MIDINKSRSNFQKFPILKQKCDPVVLVQPGSVNVNANVKANVNNTTTTAAATTTTKTKATVPTVAAGATTATTTTGTSNKHYNVNRKKSTATGSVNAGTAGTAGVRKTNEQQPPTKTHVKDIQTKLTSLSRATPANAVRAANQQFFLISAFKDQNFLKAEYELAHAQVAVPTAQQHQQQQASNVKTSNANVTHNSHTKRDKVTSVAVDNNCNSNQNNRNHNNISNRNNNNSNTNNNYNSYNSYNSRNSVGISNSHQLPRLSALTSSSSHGMRRIGNGSIYTGTTATSNIISTTPSNSTTTTACTTTTNNNNNNNNNNNTPTTNSSSKNTAATAAETGTTSTTVQRVDIVFNQFKALPKTTKSTSNYTGTQSVHSLYTAPTSSSASLCASASAFAFASVAAAAPSITSGAHSVARLGSRQLVKPLVHRTIPTTAVAAANAAATTSTPANTVAFNTTNSKANSNSNQLSHANSFNNNNNNTNTSNNVKLNGIKINVNNNNNSNSNNNNNNNSNMHQQYPCRRNEIYDQEHDDDIKYIDSDEVPTTSAPTSTMERKTVTHCEHHCNLDSGSATRSARVRPKSTIISGLSTGVNQLVFEKVNNYKYANGVDTAHVTRRQETLPMTSTPARQTGGGIDSNSIKASIEKFNSYSEQKRLPLSSVTLRSHAGSGSANNLQHHRHSGSDFEHCQLHSVTSGGGGGGSLTRTPYRSGLSSIPTASGAGVGTGPGVTSAKVVTTSIHASPAVASAYSGSVSRLASMSGRSSASSTNSLPTATKSGVGAYSSRYHEGVLSRSAERASASSLLAAANKESGHKSATPGPVRVVAQHQDAIGGGVSVADAKKHVVAAEGGACATTNDSIRSTTARNSVLPPSSPSSSRYWDRENSRTSSLSSSAYNSNSNSDDINKSTNDEKSEGLCGLRNIGNTCFMNSIIQCLSHTSELTKFLRTHNGMRSSSSKDQLILQEFAKLIREMWTSNVTTVTPMELKRAFSTKHRMYSDYNQQDAQEFLRFFLDSLHCALNTGVKGEHLKIDDNLSDNKKADLTWEWYARHENSLVRDLFVGQLKSTLKCTTCGNTSVTFDPFWDLSVPLPSSNRCKLDACLDFFIREEILDGDEMPTCSRCKTRRKCTKSFTIQRFPKYLVIHLKRFSEARWSKLSNIVEFPTSERELNMGPYGSNNNMNIYYSLYAISNHMGSTAGGHYVALCKHPISKKWHEFNDNVVSEALSENHLVSSSAYILFYERA